MAELFGWAGKILCVNLRDGAQSSIATMQHADRFVGGRGIASRLYWEQIQPETGAFDPENCLYLMNGPLAGTRAPAASRWIIVGKSPMAFPEQYACGNLGGRLGAALKWSGLDGLVISGAAAKPVILVITSDGKCTLEDAAALWGKDVFETITLLQNRYGRKACVATIGRAGEMRVRFATVIGSGGVSATKGFGAVMGAKNLKAVVVIADKKQLPLARPESFKKVKQDILRLGTGEASERYWVEPMIEDIEKIKSAYCYGCPGVCKRALYKHKSGEQGYRKTCFSAFYYGTAEQNKTGKLAEATFYATQLANRHGLCAMELLMQSFWLPKALQQGLIDPEKTGLQLEKLGTSSWIERLITMIIDRSDIGDLLAEGSRRAARELGNTDILEGIVTGTGFLAAIYNPRMFLSTAPMYATEPTFPITQLHAVSFPMVKWMVWMGTEGSMGFLDTHKLRHLAKTFWGDERAAEFDSPECTGSSAAIMQNRAFAKENIIFCDWFWPIDYSGSSKTGVGDPALEARLFSAGTGMDMAAEDFLLSGERCANLCRAIYLREGRRGRIDDTLDEFNFTRPLEEQPAPVGIFNPDLMLPGKNGELFTCKGATVDKDVFKKVMDEYYLTRSWDITTGLFTRDGLARLDLEDIMPELEKNAFLAE